MSKQPANPRAARSPRRGFLATIFGSFMGLGLLSLFGTVALWLLSTLRFMFRNTLDEPPTRFKVGPPSDYPVNSVETRFKSQFGVWVVHRIDEGRQQIVVLKAVCTHLGCTPIWLDAEQKFKCPCHGSGFDMAGVNLEGPAPRPLERYAIRIADDGQLEVDKSRTFHAERGQWDDPDCYVVPV
jgi:cytochrome b6-f complex iron-sulfur subunit